MNPPAEDLLGVLQRYSGDKLTRTEDLGILLQAALEQNALGTFEELSFHAKFVTNANETRQRAGSSNVDATRLNTEMQNEIASVTRLVRFLLAGSPASLQERFSSTYFAATPDALTNMLSLCYDLSWYKNWLIDHPGGSLATMTRAAQPTGSAVWRTALVLFILSAFTWLGALIARAVIANELLEPGTAQIAAALSADTERHLYRMLAASAIPMVTGYGVALISSIVFLRSMPLRVRENGWLLMSALLLYLFIPVEVFAMTLDVRMIWLEFFGTADVGAMRGLFLARLGALAGAPFVAVLCYLTIVPLAVFQPFRRKVQRAT